MVTCECDTNFIIIAIILIIIHLKKIIIIIIISSSCNLFFSTRKKYVVNIMQIMVYQGKYEHFSCEIFFLKRLKR